MSGDERPENRADDGTDPELERAEELAADVASHNADPDTTREAIEQDLAQEGLSEEGEHIGDTF